MNCLRYSFYPYHICNQCTIPVTINDLYTPEKGYGFVTETNRMQQPLLQVPELNAGFEPWYWLSDQPLSTLTQDDCGILLQPHPLTSMQQWPIPLHFKTNVPTQGNYTLSLRLKNMSHNAEIGRAHV